MLPHSSLPEPPSHASIYRVMKERGVPVDVGVDCPPNFKPDSSMITSGEGRMVHELQQLQHQEKRITLEFSEPSYSANVIKPTGKFVRHSKLWQRSNTVRASHAEERVHAHTHPLMCNDKLTYHTRHHNNLLLGIQHYL